MQDAGVELECYMQSREGRWFAYIVVHLFHF